MRSPATLTLVMFLTTLAVTAVAMAHAESSENPYQYSETVMNVVERQCTEGTSNESFCNCAIEALSMYLPPKYASIVSVSLGKRRIHQIFELHPDTPRYIEDQLDEATRHCREAFTDSIELR